MEEGSGWTFWIDCGGQIRQFTVAEEDQEAAQLALQTAHPEINFLDFHGKQRIPTSVIQMLKLSKGQSARRGAAAPQVAASRLGWSPEIAA